MSGVLNDCDALLQAATVRITLPVVPGAKLITLSPTEQVFKVTKAGVNSPESITLTATPQNLSGTPDFTVPIGTATLSAGANASQKVLTFANMVSDSVTIQVAQDGQIDRVTISKLRDGADGAGLAPFEPSLKWEFRNTLDGWGAVNAVTLGMAADSVTLTATGNDPIWRSPGLSLSGVLNPVIRARIKRLSGTGWDGNVYFMSSSHPGEGNGGTGYTADPTKLNEWVIAEWVMGGAVGWNSTVTSIRPDFGLTSADKFEVDWIAVGKYGAGISVTEMDAITNDGILSRNEKAKLVTDWQADDLVYTQRLAQANALGVSAQQLIDNKVATSNYLLTLSPAWNDTTKDTAIDRTLYRNRFKWLAEAGTILDNALTAKAATLANYDAVSGKPDVYRVLACGGSNAANFAPGMTLGFYRNGTIVEGVTRSYSLIVIRRSDHAVIGIGHYDVFGTGQTNGATAATMAYDMNYYADRPGQYILVVYSHDEPMNNRLDSGLPAAMYRNGASSSVFGSPEFQYRGAYVLVAISGCGPGNGQEFYQGAVSADPNAWIDVTFQLLKGNIVGMTAGYTPRSLMDFGFYGAMDSTRGAPAGTYVGGTLAQTVEANANSGATVANRPALTMNALGNPYYSFSRQISGATLGDFSAVVNNATGGITYAWSVESPSGTCVPATATNGQGFSVVSKGPTSLGEKTSYVTCTATDGAGRSVSQTAYCTWDAT